MSKAKKVRIANTDLPERRFDYRKRSRTGCVEAEDAVVLTDYQLLAYLHDSICSELRWIFRNPNQRDVQLFVTVDLAAGYPPWNGKALIVTLANVVGAHYVSWGYVAGKERIDSWREGISIWLEKECQSVNDAGLAVPPLKFTISFLSGSILELACSQVSIVEGT